MTGPEIRFCTFHGLRFKYCQKICSQGYKEVTPTDI